MVPSVIGSMANFGCLALFRDDTFDSVDDMDDSPYLRCKYKQELINDWFIANRHMCSGCVVTKQDVELAKSLIGEGPRL